MSDLKLPVDLESLPPFRSLRDAVGVNQALRLWFYLYRELTYRAQNGDGVGMLPDAGRLLIFEQCEMTTEDVQAVATAALEAGKLLMPVEGGHICPRFIESNGDAGRKRSDAQRGGDMRAFTRGVAHAEDASVQLALTLDAEKYKDRAGQPVDAETMKQVIKLILVCDRALFKNTRPKWGFREGLIFDAVDVVRRHSYDEIDSVLREIAANREHPFLAQKTTEAILPDFAGVLAHLKGKT